MAHVDELMKEPLSYAVHHTTPTTVQQSLHTTHTQHRQHVRAHSAITTWTYHRHTTLLLTTELPYRLRHIPLTRVQQHTHILRHHVQLTLTYAVRQEAHTHTHQPLCFGSGEE